MQDGLDAVDGIPFAEGDVLLVVYGLALGVDDVDRQSHLVQAVDDRLQVVPVQRECRHLLRTHSDIPHFFSCQPCEGVRLLTVGLVGIAADGRPSDEHHVGVPLLLPVADGLVGAVGRVFLVMVGEDPGQCESLPCAPLDAAQRHRPRLWVYVGVIGQHEVREEPDAAAPVCPQLRRYETVAELVKTDVLSAPRMLAVVLRGVSGGLLATAPAVLEVLAVCVLLFLVSSCTARVIRLVCPIAVKAVGLAAVPVAAAVMLPSSGVAAAAVQFA